MKRLIICDKNKGYIQECKQAFDGYGNIQCVHGDIMKLHEKTPNSRIVTASNPSFSPDGGLDYKLAKEYNWQGGEFALDDDLFYVVSVDDNRKANNEIIQRAVTGVYAYGDKRNMMMSCLGCGVGGFDIDDFIKNIKNIFGENDLRSADLRSADLRSANLRSANLRSADLESVKINELTIGILSVCPEEGTFIGWKKAKDKAIIKLRIPASAMRSSATTRKCRCSKAKVLGIWDREGMEIDETCSDYNYNFLYKKGKTVKVDDFDKNRWNECSTGIHFFITKEEAIQYNS